MTDMSMTIAPKSDQLNSDDLIGGPRTITITKVGAIPSSSEQPIAISFQGDEGKPYKPCKSMRRVMVQVWGKDGASYVGRSMTLYRDPTVTWGGMAVGGIRISHMSDIGESITMALTASKQSRKPYTVKPLVEEKAKPRRDKSPIDVYAQELAAELEKAATAEDAAAGVEALSLWWANTGERRIVLNIPADRLEKMRLAVDKVINPDGA